MCGPAVETPGNEVRSAVGVGYLPLGLATVVEVRVLGARVGGRFDPLWASPISPSMRGRAVRDLAARAFQRRNWESLLGLPLSEGEMGEAQRGSNLPPTRAPRTRTSTTVGSKATSHETMKTRDVLGFGCATMDELFFIEEWPVADKKIPISRRETQGGGLGATALIAAARMGARCSYAGMLGRDETSKQITQLLRAEGIDVDLIAYHEEAGAIRAWVFVDTASQTRNVFMQRPARIGTPQGSPSEAEIAASKCVFLDHYGGQGNVRICELARKHAVPVVADFERDNVPHFFDFFPLVSHLILSRGFASRLSNETQPEFIARALWNANRQTVVITCGEEGSFATQDGRTVLHHPAFATEVVDTTGCGDCFHGVYCATLAWDWPLAKRLEWASAAASLKARVSGAQRGLPTRGEVEKFLEAS